MTDPDGASAAADAELYIGTLYQLKHGAAVLAAGGEVLADALLSSPFSHGSLTFPGPEGNVSKFKNKGDAIAHLHSL